jgi:tetratricopeptide (TPR) repeat protein
VQYHAETLAELVDEDARDPLPLAQATVERKAFDLWHDGYHDKAIAKIEKALIDLKSLDTQTRGWMEQTAARIANQWGHTDRAEDLQRQAYAHNRNLLRPQVLPPYRPLVVPGKQERAIVAQISEYRLRRGFLQRFEGAVAYLHHDSSSNQFEQALADLGTMIGLSSERRDVHGEGPDVLWLLPSKVGVVIEAKSRKKEKNALTKDEHGQLLVAAEWFTKNYPDFSAVRASVFPKNLATKAAVAGASHALTYERLSALVADSRALLTRLCESQLSSAELVAECSRLLAKSTIAQSQLVDSYFTPFQD